MSESQTGAPGTEGSGTGREDQAETDRPIVPAHDAERKRLTHLQAVAALAGIAITPVEDGYVVSRWAMSRDCADLDVVADLLKRQGVQI